MSGFAAVVAAEREHRLLRLLKMGAPAAIVDQEARLVLASHRGSHLRVIGWLVRELVRSRLNWWRDGLQFWLHATALARGFHWKFPGLGFDCLICEANIPPDDEDDKEAAHALGEEATDGELEGASR